LQCHDQEEFQVHLEVLTQRCGPPLSLAYLSGPQLELAQSGNAQHL